MYYTTNIREIERNSKKIVNDNTPSGYIKNANHEDSYHQKGSSGHYKLPDQTG